MNKDADSFPVAGIQEMAVEENMAAQMDASGYVYNNANYRLVARRNGLTYRIAVICCIEGPPCVGVQTGGKGMGCCL